MKAETEFKSDNAGEKAGERKEQPVKEPNKSQAAVSHLLYTEYIPAPKIQWELSQLAVGEVTDQNFIYCIAEKFGEH